MEKSKPHYLLPEIKRIVAEKGISVFTETARRGVMSLMLSDDEALGILAGLNGAMFYKSMTTFSDHRIWQDVYHAPCPNGKTAYIKVTLKDDAIVIQFKEK
jgi:motility quorum-sensing regulator/GCU-specific mRNA interferase toxin